VAPLVRLRNATLQVLINSIDSKITIYSIYLGVFIGVPHVNRYAAVERSSRDW
jgi:hypothetical protein